MPVPARAAARLRILPLASAFNPPDAVRATVERVAQAMRAHGIEPDMVSRAPESPDALLIVTGGTEHLALESLDRRDGPAILIAHPEQNSLPAAIEILARVRQLGRRGLICLLNDRADGFEALARVSVHLDVRRRFRASRLGRIGAPSDWLVASMPDAAAVAEVWGPQVIDVPMAAVVDALRRVDQAEVAAIRSDFESSATRIAEPTPADLDAAARVAAALALVAAEHRLDACSVRCFDLVTAERTTGCLAVSWLLDRGVVAGCEGDLPATLTMMWLQAMTGGPAFMANPQDVDVDANTIALAHCTIARRLVSGYALRSHFESSLGVGIEGALEPGDATVARAGGVGLRDVFVSDATIAGCGDNPRRCRTQVQVRLSADARALLTRPIGNHLVLVRGHREKALREYHDLFIA